MWAARHRKQPGGRLIAAIRPAGASDRFAATLAANRCRRPIARQRFGSELRAGCVRPLVRVRSAASNVVAGTARTGPSTNWFHVQCRAALAWTWTILTDRAGLIGVNPIFCASWAILPSHRGRPSGISLSVTGIGARKTHASWLSAFAFNIISPSLVRSQRLKHTSRFASARRVSFPNDSSKVTSALASTTLHPFMYRLA